jgi:predicted PurR-regulated permease PerM
MVDHTNFLLILIIVVVAMFILLCPRKNINQQKELFNYQSNIWQQNPQYLTPAVELVPNINGQELSKANIIQRMNMEYDTRGDINDLINLNQIPHNGSMFVYP